MSFEDGSLDGLGNLLRYPGGKSRLRKKLLKHFPEHRTYVEPFAGGASMFFAKEPAEVEALNDVNRRLMDFYRGVAKGGLRRCRYTSRKELFDRLKAKERAGKRLSACEFFIMNKLSYGGEMDHFTVDPADIGVQNPKARKVMQRLPEFERRLRRARLSCGDFEKTMKKYDSPSTFFFIDPPYEKAVGKEMLKKYYSAGSASPERVRQAAVRVKGKVMITYGDHPDIRKLFCGRGKGFRCFTVGTKYSQKFDQRTRGPEWRDVRELVITNYPLQRQGGSRRRPR